ncbi:MAG: hypothetical protein JXA74_00490 [Anaerolineae bacterium]|nr:hypothetical protein [Anaerolineae bacterium]
MSESERICPLTGEPILERLAPHGRPEEELHLTATHIGKHTRAWGGEALTCIPLAQLSSASYVSRVRWGWLGGAAAAVLVALALAYLALTGSGGEWGSSAAVAGLIALLCVLAYTVTRSQELVFKASAGEVRLRIARPRTDAARALVRRTLEQQLALLGGQPSEPRPPEAEPAPEPQSEG